MSLRTIVQFHTPTCPPCRQITPQIERAIARNSEPVRWVRVDATEDTEAVATYGVSAVPTLIYFDESGTEYHRTVGYRSADEIWATIAP